MTTPDKYKPEPRKYDQKHWLYEQYWSKFYSTYEIADKADVSADTIKRRLRELGIPRRTHRYARDNNVSAFSGFYSGENAQVDNETTPSGVEELDEDNLILSWNRARTSKDDGIKVFSDN